MYKSTFRSSTTHLLLLTYSAPQTAEYFIHYIYREDFAAQRNIALDCHSIHAKLPCFAMTVGYASLFHRNYKVTVNVVLSEKRPKAVIAKRESLRSAVAIQLNISLRSKALS
jgi:hypothetical protein